MMLRWKHGDYTETTLDQVSQVTVLGTWGPEDEFPDYADQAGVETVVMSRIEPHVTTSPPEVQVWLLVECQRYGRVVMQVNCIMAWILNDQGDTVDTLFMVR